MNDRKSGRPTILLVDDEPIVRGFLRTLLRRHGFAVLVACHGEEASRICTRFSRPIDVMITDVAMPGMSGFDLAKVSQQLRPAMPVLFMSGGYDPQTVDEDQRIVPHAGFLTKPFTARTVLSKIQSLLAA
jgi:two-component system cell cycle sensor histidine kinase/response regulator CckA